MRSTKEWAGPAAALAAVGLAALGWDPAVAAAQPAAAASDAACEALGAAPIAAGFEVVSARRVAPSGPDAGPSHCEVRGVVRPTAGSRIGVVYRLPDRWNGRILGLGGGGWAGNVRPAAAEPGLAKGYATLQTDAGHESPDPADAGWSLRGPGVADEDAIADFAWRAVHEMTVVGKQVVARRYGRAADRAYFQGCSTGGRQGLVEAQRFPDDYDAIIAGAPVYDLVVQTSALVRTQFFHKDPESNLRPAQVEATNRAVLAACDSADGAADGIVADQAACRWDPEALSCRRVSGPDCLSPKQVATVRNAYAGLKTADGRVVAWPLPRGGELDWIARSVGDPRAPLGSNATTGARAIQFFIYRDPDYDIMRWSPASDFGAVRGSAFARTYEAADPDLGAFVRRGGKLILWHGAYDPGPSPLGTVEYFVA